MLEMSSEAFASVVFANIAPDARPWFGGLRTAKSDGAPPDLRAAKKALYFSNTSFRGDGRRRKEFAATVHVIVLDDVGTKVKANSLEPTYKIESSAGNWQWGYVLSEPMNTSDADHLFARIKAKGDLGDAGALKVNQLLRMPGGIHAKAGDTPEQHQYRVRLTHWEPDYVFTIDELIEGWGLPDVDRLPAAASLVNTLPATTAQLQAHPVFQYLKNEGMVVSVERNVVHIDGARCPLGEHSGYTGDKQVSIFFDADGAFGIHCFHEHAALIGDPQAAFRAWLPEEVSASVRDARKAHIGTAEFLHDRFIYVTQDNGYFDVGSRELLKPEVLNRVYRADYPGDKRGATAATSFDSAPLFDNKTGQGKRVVKGCGWLPIDDTVIELHGEKFANTFRGMPLEPVEGDVAEWLTLMAFVYGEHADLVIDHMAFSVQYPMTKIRWQVMCFGEQRTGKSMTVSPLSYIWGSAAHVVTPEEATAGWGDMWIGRKVVIFNEVNNPGERDTFNKLKPKLSDSDVEMLNRKSQTGITQQNLYSIYLFSNHADALHFDREEDKLLVIEAPKASERWAKERYAKLAQWIENGGAAKIYHFLVHRDVSDFSYGVLPVRTAAATRMHEEGKPDYAIAIQGWYEAKVRPFALLDVYGFVTIDVVRNTLRHANYACGDKGVCRELASLGLVRVRGTKKVNGEVRTTPRLWAIKAEVEGLSPAEIYDRYQLNYVEDDSFLVEKRQPG